MKSITLRKTVGAIALAGVTFAALPVQADPAQGPYGPGGMGPGMMGGNGRGYGMGPGATGGNGTGCGNGAGYGMGPGMMGGGGGYGMGPGMMGGGGGYGMGPGMMGGGGGYGMGPGMMGGYGPGAALNLTDEQQAKVAKIRDDMRHAQWALMGQMMDARSQMSEQYFSDKRDDAALSKAYKKMSDLRQQMFEQSLAMQKQVDEVLTKEQRETLRRGRSAMRGY